MLKVILVFHSYHCCKLPLFYDYSLFKCSFRHFVSNIQNDLRLVWQGSIIIIKTSKVWLTDLIFLMHYRMSQSNILLWIMTQRKYSQRNFFEKTSKENIFYNQSPPCIYTLHVSIFFVISSMKKDIFRGVTLVNNVPISKYHQ